MKFVSLSIQIIAGVPRRETNRSNPITQELLSMDGTTLTWTARIVRQEEKSPPLLSSPTNGDVEWAEVIKPGIGKGRRLVCESFLWDVVHDRLNGCCTELSTQDAV